MSKIKAIQPWAMYVCMFLTNLEKIPYFHSWVIALKKIQVMLMLSDWQLFSTSHQFTAVSLFLSCSRQVTDSQLYHCFSAVLDKSHLTAASLFLCCSSQITDSQLYHCFSAVLNKSPTRSCITVPQLFATNYRLAAAPLFLRCSWQIKISHHSSAVQEELRWRHSSDSEVKNTCWKIVAWHWTRWRLLVHHLSPSSLAIRPAGMQLLRTAAAGSWWAERAE